jgi:hypothetical protein
MEQKTVHFNVQDILPLVLILGVAGIGTAYVLNIESDIQSDFTAGTAEYNATTKLIEGTSVFADKQKLIATVVVAAILIGILVRYLMVKMS